MEINKNIKRKVKNVTKMKIMIMWDLMMMMMMMMMLVLMIVEHGGDGVPSLYIGWARKVSGLSQNRKIDPQSSCNSCPVW